MKSKAYGFLAVILAVAMLITQVACTAEWINTALTDLPIVIQIVTNIAGLIAVAQGNGAIDPADAARIAAFGAEAKSDLTLAQTLYNQYKSAPDSDRQAILGKLSTALALGQGNLQSIMTSLHLKNAGLQTAIATAVGLALTTVQAIATLVPPTGLQVKASLPRKPLEPAKLKAAFNAAVGEYPQFAIQ